MATLSDFARRRGAIRNSDSIKGLATDTRFAPLVGDQVATNRLENVNFSGIQANAKTRFKDEEDLIRSRTDPALAILDQGTEESQRLLREAREQGISPLQAIASDTRAFDEQRALLGLEGEQAQEQAIGNIPVTEFDRRLQERLQKQQLRSAAATGDLGSGATIEGAQTLAGTIQAQNIQKRLDQLQPLTAISRGASTAISDLEERSGSRLAQNILGSGTQRSNIRFGSAAPQIESIQNRAELSGLSDIARANRQAGTINTLATLAGRFTPTSTTRTVDPATQNILV